MNRNTNPQEIDQVSTSTEPTEPIRILWSGLTGKTGRAALKIARERPDVEIVAGLTRRDEAELASLNIDGETFDGINWCQYDESSLLVTDLGPFDVVVDFSHAQQLELVAGYASMVGKPLISGTAGLATAHLEALRQRTSYIPIFRGGNFQFAVKSFIDDAVAYGIDHPDEILIEAFFGGKIVPSETFQVIQRRIYEATGQTIGVQSSTPFARTSLVCDWRFGSLHCRTVGFENLANNILDIAKVMVTKPLAAGQFYDLDQLWPDLQPPTG